MNRKKAQEATEGIPAQMEHTPQDSTGTGPGIRTSMKASRLHEAIKAADKQSSNSDSALTRVMNDNAKTFDIRAVIFGTFYRCGFDLHELSAKEKQ